MWSLFKFLPKVSLTAAQKENYNTKVMLLEAKHEKAVEVLQAEIRDLHSEAERLKKENEELQSANSILRQSLKWYEDMERAREEPPQPGDAGF